MIQEQEEIVAELRKRLNAAELRSYDFEVFESGIRREEDWWFIPVSARGEGVRPFDYAPKLSDIEEAFEAEGIKVLLIPAEAI
ncbi:MAG TPA: hypothetical protein VGM03_03965 [Phycisphaerae bacterium]|jgi:hypothetical protein